MSVIQSVAAMQYTMLMNNSAYNMMSANHSRMNLLSAPMSNISFGSLAAMDTQLELESLTNSLQYKMAKAMLEQLEKQRKEDAKQFSTFA